MRFSDVSSDVCASDPALFERFNIEVIATTESPLDPLTHHQAIRDSGWNGRVVTTYRPPARRYSGRDAPHLRAGQRAGAGHQRAGRAASPSSTPSARDSAVCRSEEHTSELQSLMRISYVHFRLKKQK